MELFITVMTVLVVAVQMLHLYFYGKGILEKAYPIAVVVYVGFLILETTLAFNHPTQYSLILFNICNLWGLMNAVQGCIRINKKGQENDKKSNQEVEPCEGTC